MKSVPGVTLTFAPVGVTMRVTPAGTVHGSPVDVYGCGLLFTGRSGIGMTCLLDCPGVGETRWSRRSVAVPDSGS